MSKKTKADLMMATFEAMKTYTASSISAIYCVMDKESGRLGGSGTFVTLRGRPYLLTAGHVIWENLDHEGLAYSTSYGASPRPIVNPYNVLGPPSDLAVVRLQNDGLLGTSKAPLSTSAFAKDSTGVDDDLLFIHGFPGAKSKPIRLLGGVFSTTYPYGAATGACQYDWFDPQLHVALDFSPNGMMDEHGRQTDFVDPHGLSGAALWKTNRAGTTAADWSPTMARIVGVIHSWDDKANSLVATRIEVVRHFLLDVLRQECAYFLWRERGMPASDDWVDWFSAVDQITDL